jgi:hypothetical protein
MVGMCYGLVISACPFKLTNYWMDKKEIWYRCCAMGDYLQITLLNILRPIVTKQWMREFVKWGTQVAKVRSMFKAKTMARSIPW